MCSVQQSPNKQCVQSHDLSWYILTVNMAQLLPWWFWTNLELPELLVSSYLVPLPILLIKLIPFYKCKTNLRSYSLLKEWCNVVKMSNYIIHSKTLYRFIMCRHICFWLISLHRCSLGRSKVKLQQCMRRERLYHSILLSYRVSKTLYIYTHNVRLHAQYYNISITVHNTYTIIYVL